MGMGCDAPTTDMEIGVKTLSSPCTTVPSDIGNRGKIDTVMRL